MPIAGTLNLNGCNYQFGWDLISQDVANNTSTVSFYGILNPTGNYVAWSSGTASIHTAQAQLRTRYTQSEVVVQSNFTFKHNNDGTLTLAPGYGINTTFTSGSGTVIIQLPQIKRFATITATPSSLTDEDDPYITFTNPGNATNLNVWLEVNPNGTHYATRNLDITSGTYTWELTEAERNQLRAELKTSNTGKIRLGLYSTQSGTTNASYKDIPFEIINATPTQPDFYISEADPIILEEQLTSGNFINYYSDVRATITTQSQAQKGGTIVKYRFVFGDKTIDFPSGSNNVVLENIPPIRTGTIYKIEAIDNRGNIGESSGRAFGGNGIGFIAISLDKEDCSLERTSTGENATLTFSGMVDIRNFGNKTNEIRSVQYRLKNGSELVYFTTNDTNYLKNKNYYSYNGSTYTLLVEGTDYNVGDIITGTVYQDVGTTTITPTIEGEPWTTRKTFSFTGLIAGDNNTEWNLEDVYEVELTISDYLSSDTVSFVLNSARPNICIDKNGVGINCVYDSNLGGSLQVNGKVVGENVYSTTDEIETNDKWIDGKTIYRKVIYVSSLPNATSTTYNHEITGASLVWVDMQHTFIKWSSGDTAPFNYLSVSAGTTISYNPMIELRGVNTTSFTIATGYNRSGLGAYITLLYTKN